MIMSYNLKIECVMILCTIVFVLLQNTERDYHVISHSRVREHNISITIIQRARASMCTMTF